MILKPSPCRVGDTIGVISPASPPGRQKAALLQRGIAYLQQRGFLVKQGEAIQRETGYLAGSDKERVTDLNSMFSDPSITAIFCSRGGFGSSRILKEIDYETIRQHAKIFVGYSDVTALQMALLKKTGLVTFSGPMVATDLGRDIDPETEASLWSAIQRPVVKDLIQFPDHVNCQPFQPGLATGRLLGGCLSVLVTLLGTAYCPDFKNAILILEDIGEDLYKIDRYLAQLENSGVLNQLSGVVLGDFLDIKPDENPNPMNFDKVINRYLGKLNCPVITEFPYGHGARKITVPVGCQVEIDGNNGRLNFLETGVANA